STTLNLNEDSRLAVKNLASGWAQDRSRQEAITPAKRMPGRHQTMINKNFFRFVDEILDRQRITAKDVAYLQREILPDGIAFREEADVLIALDRAVKEQDASLADCLVAMV